ncbi:MAG: hypothetical protein AB8I08_12675 [Sandaracinaceae bacterium]
MLLASVGFAQTSEAQSLSAADRAYADGALAEAGRAYEDALSAGGLSRAQVAHTHLRLAALAALGQEQARFERHAAAALTLDPELPAPVLEQAYAARFSELVGEARRLRLQLSEADGRVSVEVLGSHELVRTVTLRGHGGWARTLPWQGARLTLAPPEASRPLRVEGVDVHGNTVVTAGVEPPERAAGRPEAPTAPVEQQSEESAIIESPWLWIGVGILVVGIGLVVGLTAFGERFVLDAPVVR